MINGPPCHILAILQYLSHSLMLLSLKVDTDYFLPYTSYVRKVLACVRLWGGPIHLDMQISAWYIQEYDLCLQQARTDLVSRHRRIANVISLELRFPEVEEDILLISFIMQSRLLR
jgi:hypothetical protein